MTEPGATGTNRNDVDGADRILDLLRRSADGDKQAFDALLPLIYAELRAQARRAMASTGRPGDVSTTVLVNETYLKLVGSSNPDWHGRAQFLAYSARTMRSILVDTARSLSASKRVDDHRVLTIEQVGPLSPSDLVTLDAALSRLREQDQRLAEVVEMSFFAGMTAVEIGSVLGVTARTVERDWAKARILLALDDRAESGGSEPGSSGPGSAGPEPLEPGTSE